MGKEFVCWPTRKREKGGGRSGNDLLWNAAATKGGEEGEEEPRPPFSPLLWIWGK